MKITLDRAADASYIEISNKKIAKTISASDYCNIDIDEDGALVGIELLFISKYMSDFKLWLGLDSVAQYLNKSPITIRRWTREGRLPHYKPGGEYMFVKDEVDEFIRQQKRA